MNDRIQELYITAMREDCGEKWDTQEEFIERFAELIVKECASISAQTPCPYEDEFARQTYGHTWDMACVESAKAIRKHFGVEE